MQAFLKMDAKESVSKNGGNSHFVLNELVNTGGWMLMVGCTAKRM